VTDLSSLPIQDLLDLLSSQSATIDRLEARVRELEAEIAQMRNGPPSSAAKTVPSFVKPNKAPREKMPRKKRAQGYSRPCEKATRVVPHAVDNCPDCNRKLTGGWVHRKRQVIEIPQASYEVIEHLLIRRRCGVCGRLHLAKPDLAHEVAGKHRVGIRLMSLIVAMKKVGRMTVRGIQQFLKNIYGLHLSEGSIIELLKDVARRGKPFYEQLKQALRDSQSISGDETSWRVNGRNTWMWSFSTPDIRYFEANNSRGHQVPKDVLGEEFHGVLTSDFYAAYSFYLGEHQRCWVHFLRDLDELVAKNADNAALARWARRVRRVWREATDFKSDDPRERVRARRRFQKRLVAIAQPYCKQGDAASVQRVLANRLCRFANEMFTFVEHLGVTHDNNAAERAVRPAVIYRKVTGGSRSDEGAKTTAVLMSLMHTWAARQLNPFVECIQMLQSLPAQVLSHEV
jgi:cell division protein FtsB